MEEIGDEEFNEEKWKDLAAKKAKELPEAGYSEELWLEYFKEQHERRNQKGRGKGKGRGKKGKEDVPPPEKLAGDKWEKPRAEIGMMLLGEKAPEGVKWQYHLSDDSRRSYAGYLQSPIPEDVRKDFFQKCKEGTEWKQPEGKMGVMPRKTAWMVCKGCTCDYKYGSVCVAPQEFPEWMTSLLKIIMPSCGIAEEKDWPTSCNLNLYEDGGMSVGWHADDEMLFQGKVRDISIVSLSLGVTRKFELRLNWPEAGERPVKRINLSSGDLMTMEGMVQKHYMHRVPREENIEGERINLTWRWTLKHRPRCAAGRRRMER